MNCVQTKRKRARDSSMKKRIVTSIVVLFFLGSMCVEVLIHNLTYVHAENKNDLNDLIPYEKELESLNKEWGTNYKLQVENGNTEQEMVEYFTSMSIEEFREYIKDVHEVDVESREREQINRNIKVEETSLP